MIPKTIHYCWFGENKKNELIEKCITSWKATCPDFQIIEWNEKNFDVHAHPFTKKMYSERKWAFVADYARLHTLYEHGGIYLDTDMLITRSLSPLLETELLLGKESDEYISCGMIGATQHHPFIKSFMGMYDTITTLQPNPIILTELYNKNPPENTLVLPPVAFYPFTSDTIKNYQGQVMGKDVYGIHLWNYSWGHPLNRFFKKIGVYYYGKKITEKLGIKNFIKKLLGFV